MQKNKSISLIVKAAGLIGGLMLFAYSFLRSVDLIASTLPLDKQIFAWFAVLGGVDGALLYWVYSFIYEAQGAAQKTIAGFMAIVSFIGTATAVIADTFLQANKNFKFAPSDMDGAIWGVSLLILLNVGIKLLFEACNPKHLQISAEDDFEAEINQAVLIELKQDKTRLASELAKELVASRQQVIADKMRAYYQAKPAQLPAPSKLIDVKVGQTIERPPIYSPPAADSGSDESAGPVNFTPKPALP